MGYAFHVRGESIIISSGTKEQRHHGVGCFLVRWVVGRQDGEVESALARHDVDIRG